MLTKTEKLMILLVAIGAMCIYLSWNRTRIQREEIMVVEEATLKGYLQKGA